MQTIYKYPIQPEREFTVRMPQGARAIHVACQRNEVFVWAIVDTELPEEDIRFRLLGTGHPFDPDGWRHIATWLMEDDTLVWHLFQEQGTVIELAGYADSGGPDRFDDEDDPL
jgi:hypothetical protein